MRRHVAAVYAFARAADDFADEGERPRDERCALLDRWDRRLRVAAGLGDQLPPAPGEPPNAREIFLALGATIHETQLPLELLRDLLSAFRQDVDVSRYATWQELGDYCRRSANPIGRLVLRIAGYQSARLDGWSDAVCTALQLTNFWQDLGRDYARGRLYVPAEALTAHGAREDDLRAPVMTAAWRDVLAAAIERTRRLFECGRPIADALSGRLRYGIRATWLGGMRVLTLLQASGLDPIRHRPRLGAADVPWLAWRLSTWSW